MNTAYELAAEHAEIIRTLKRAGVEEQRGPCDVPEVLVVRQRGNEPAVFIMDEHNHDALKNLVKRLGPVSESLVLMTDTFMSASPEMRQRTGARPLAKAFEQGDMGVTEALVTFAVCAPGDDAVLMVEAYHYDDAGHILFEPSEPCDVSAFRSGFIGELLLHAWKRAPRKHHR